MKNIIITLVICGLFSTMLSSQNLPKTKNYNLDFKIDYQNEKLFGRCELTLENQNPEPVINIPLILYRTLKVTGVTDGSGKNLNFSQQVVSFADFEAYQANYIEVSLEEPLRKGEEKILTINYSGHLLGYSETGMSYIKDNISPQFTILRTDCNAYPAVTYPTIESRRNTIRDRFDYIINITVPDSLTAANGGRLTAFETTGGYSTYTYANIKPAWRIDVAIAKYKILEHDRFKVFCFPEDSTGAFQLIDKFRASKDLYSSWWGPLKNFEGLSVIEIPDGWGSQTDVTCIIQTAAAFKDADESRQLYHEVSHLWYVPEKTDPPSRWNEGLAMFIQYLTVEKLESKQVLQEAAKSTMVSINNSYAKNPHLKDIPVVDFGNKKVTGLSYSVGMIMCYVLYEITGSDNFHKAFREFYSKYHETGASLYYFIELAGKNSNKDMTDFTEDWVTSNNYTNFITGKMSVEEITERYK